MAVREIGKNKFQIDVRRGRKNRIRKVFYGTKEAACILEREIKKQLGIVSRVTDTIADLIEPYLRWVSNHQKAKTYREKKKMIYSNLLHFFGNMVPEFIDRPTIEIYKEKRLEEIRKKGRYEGYRAVNLEMLCLQGMVNWAYEYGYCSEPLVRTKNLPYRRPLPNPLSYQETMQFVDFTIQCAECRHTGACDSYRMNVFFKAFFLCLYHSAMRFNEASHLEWQNVLFNQNVIKIIGKGGSEEYVPMTETLKDALIQLREYRKTGEQLVFPSPLTGRALTNVKCAIQRGKERTGIKSRIHPHLLRHNCATHLLEAGYDIRFIQALLRHKSVTTTQIYTKVTLPYLKDMVATLECGQNVVNGAKKIEGQNPSKSLKLNEPCRIRTYDPLIKRK